MSNDHSVDDLLDFLVHAGERGLMPAATAQALGVACRNVFGILSDQERLDVRTLDLEAVVKRFNNKRAKEFNPASLREYGRRGRRAVDLFLQWRGNPAEFSVKTRTTTPGRNRVRSLQGELANGDADVVTERRVSAQPGGYPTAFPIRPGHVVTMFNVPDDMNNAEAERLAQFIKMLAVG